MKKEIMTKNHESVGSQVDYARQSNVLSDADKDVRVS